MLRLCSWPMSVLTHRLWAKKIREPVSTEEPLNRLMNISLIALNSTVDEALVATYSDRSLTTAGNALPGWDFDKYINANSPESIMGIPFTANGDGSYSKEEGGAYQTRLIIAGNYYDGNQSKGTRYFHIPLKLVGDAGNVASNKFFKVSATITGEGSPNPDEILENACINFSIEVAPWNVVEQTEDDTN